MASGDVDGAIARLESVISVRPDVEALILLGELLEKKGSRAAASERFELVRQIFKLAKANGVQNDLEIALFEADQGSARLAVTSAQAEWNRRHSIHAADALAWALHRAGDDRSALAYAKQAARTGYVNLAFAQHRKAIERALQGESR